MSGSLAYVDSSALLKLLFAEDESATFEAVISEWPDLVSSTILEVEVHRAAYREDLDPAAVDVIVDAVSLMDVDTAIRRVARRFGPATLRGMDAIHLATAASLGTDLGVLFTYDIRMLDGALLEGLPAWAPKPS